MKVSDLIIQTERLLEKLRKIPDQDVEMNQLRNFKIIDPKDGAYVGYIDFVNGVVDTFNED